MCQASVPVSTCRQTQSLCFARGDKVLKTASEAPAALHHPAGRSTTGAQQTRPAGAIPRRTTDTPRWRAAPRGSTDTPSWNTPGPGARRRHCSGSGHCSGITLRGLAAVGSRGGPPRRSKHLPQVCWPARPGAAELQTLPAALQTNTLGNRREEWLMAHVLMAICPMRLPLLPARQYRHSRSGRRLMGQLTAA